MDLGPRYCTNCGEAIKHQATSCSRCGRPLQASILPPEASTSLHSFSSNSLLKQRYRVISHIGQGGMGTVYQATDIELNRLVAIKEMSQRGLRPQEITEAVDSFKHEAHMLASLHHPNLPSIHDYFNEGRRWYFVMEFIQGITLQEYVDRVNNKWLPVKEVLDIGVQLCSVLDYLHNHKPSIVFRDLKPLNVMRSHDGHLYLIDFGIARHFKPGQSKDSKIFLTLGYAAPEQYGKAQTTFRSDIYSLGATLHYLLSGRKPSLNEPTVFDFPPLQSHGQFIPPRLEKLIMRMLEKDENNRPASMTVIKQELQDIVAQLEAKEIVQDSPDPSRLSRRRFLVGSLGLAGIGIGITWLAISHSPSHSTGNSPTPTRVPSPTHPIVYPLLAHSYTGEAVNTTYSYIGVKGNISLSRIMQTKGTISGFCNVSYPHNPFICGSGPFKGNINPNGMISFTVSPNDRCRGTTITYVGFLQPNHSFRGNFMPSSGGTGTWWANPSS